MTTYNKIIKLFLAPIIAVLFCTAVTGCKDDEGLQGSEYGYVQFKLCKSTSAEAQSASRTVTDRLERLADAKKIQVVLLHDGTTVSQTLLLNSYNDTNAEFGVRSDKLQLVAGVYRVVGYYLYDGVDELLYTGGSGENSDFTVVSGGLHVQELSANAASRGMVKFQLEKVLKSRATEEGYLFSSIAEVDVQVKNMFTREVTAFEKLKVTYETGYEESVGGDNPDDKYKEIGKASCDSVVWLPAGTYQVISYSAYSRSGASRSELESQVVVNGESFVVADIRYDNVALSDVWQVDEVDKQRLQAVDMEPLSGRNRNHVPVAAGSCIDEVRQTVGQTPCCIAFVHGENNLLVCKMRAHFFVKSAEVVERTCKIVHQNDDLCLIQRFEAPFDAHGFNRVARLTDARSVDETESDAADVHRVFYHITGGAVNVTYDGTVFTHQRIEEG